MMLILGIVIAIISFVVAILMSCLWDMEDSSMILGFLSVCLFIASAIGMLICFEKIGENKIIDSKITMYQKENKNIEKQIDTLVKEYMQYEGSTLKEFSSESSITLVTLYPDLKSDELVKTQIELYTENNNKIKKLKEKKLNYKLTKWWLYFG